jgi:hypothetical protein
MLSKRKRLLLLQQHKKADAIAKAEADAPANANAEDDATVLHVVFCKMDVIKNYKMFHLTNLFMYVLSTPTVRDQFKIFFCN